MNVETQDRYLSTEYGDVFTRRWRTNLARKTPIVLLHDSLGCVELWRDFPERLAAATARDVIAYDRLGFGRSAPHPGGWSTRFIRDEAERLFLAAQQLARRPLGQRRDLRPAARAAGRREQPPLSGAPIPLRLCRLLQQAVERRAQSRARMPHAVEGARVDQGVPGRAVHQL